MQKARRHPGSRRRAPTACRQVVSGSLSSPGRGSSHLSLALLGSLSVAREYLALRDGPRGFGPAFTCQALLRCRTGGPIDAAYGTITHCGRPFQVSSANEGLDNSLPLKAVRPYNPDSTTPAGLTCYRFGLFPLRSPLLGESRLLSVPPGTEMVHFPGSATPAYEFSRRDRGLPSTGCPIRRSPGQSLFAAHRSLSQLATSFIAVLCQGIHCTPLVA